MYVSDKNAYLFAKLLTKHDDVYPVIPDASCDPLCYPYKSVFNSWPDVRDVSLVCETNPLQVSRYNLDIRTNINETYTIIWSTK